MAKSINDAESQAIYDQVIDYGRSLGIVCYDTDGLKPETPSNANPAINAIIINLNTPNKRHLPYEAAHEIEHVVLEHHGVCTFDGRDVSGQEGEANRGAIDLLVPMYFEDRPQESADVYQFMDALAIPGTMRDYVEEAVCTFYHQSKWIFY